MKRFFTIICFLFLSLALRAQMTMEEISYVPSPSGYYNNLIVKGNAKINNIVTHPFFIRAYSSLLNFNVVPEDSYLFIRQLDVNHQKGAVILKESKDDEGNFQSYITEPPEHNERGGGDGEGGGNRAEELFVNFYMNGGILSASSLDNDGDSSFSFEVSNVYSTASIPSAINIQTQDVTTTAPTGTDIAVRDFYVFGMKIPYCPNNYYWQKVKVKNTVYKVLACNTTSCAYPEKEEACIQRNTTRTDSPDPTPNQYIWHPTTCVCEYNGVSVPID